MVNVRCALRLRCRGPRAGRPGGRAPGSAPRARAPGSVSLPVAPLSLSRPAGLSPRGRHGLRAEATRPRRRLLLLRRPSSRSPRRGTTPWEPRFPSGALWVGAGAHRAREARSPWRFMRIAQGEHGGRGSGWCPLTRGMGRLGCGFRAGTGRLSWADAGVGSVAPESRPAAHRAPFLLGVEQVPGRQHPPLARNPGPPGGQCRPQRHPQLPGAPGTLAPPESQNPRNPGTPEPPFLQGLRTRAHVFPAE